jgi:dipeptidyl aminopeptidase/acylaminoacyl peptidase
VGSYEDMLETYYSRINFLQRLAPKVIEEFGLPSENPEYWNRIDPFSYLDFINGPVQLHHGTSDSSVPFELSVSLNNALMSIGKEVELFQYPGADHNLYGADFDTAMARTVEFFRTNLE